MVQSKQILILTAALATSVVVAAPLSTLYSREPTYSIESRAESRDALEPGSEQLAKRMHGRPPRRRNKGKTSNTNSAPSRNPWDSSPEHSTVEEKPAAAASSSQKQEVKKESEAKKEEPQKRSLDDSGLNARATPGPVRKTSILKGSTGKSGSSTPSRQDSVKWDDDIKAAPEASTKNNNPPIDRNDRFVKLAQQKAPTTPLRPAASKLTPLDMGMLKESGPDKTQPTTYNTGRRGDKSDLPNQAAERVKWDNDKRSIDEKFEDWLSRRDWIGGEVDELN